MSEVKGMLKTCDRCGESVFLKAIGVGELDGGFTKWSNFEDAPEGWIWNYDTRKLLCPKCSAAYISIVKQFMEQVDGEE